MSERPNFNELVERLPRVDLKKALRLLRAGYTDLLEQVLDGEIDIDTAMQIFNGRRP